MKSLVFELGRVTIEMKTPLTIGTGGGDDLRDAVCVTTPDGIPTIPGSSIAGALRHALAPAGKLESDDGIRSLFGFQEKSEGASSRLRVSWAQAHGADGQPLPFRRPGGRSVAEDPVAAATG
ncbi:MAG: RAMP superfamily CRISPR-associated protein, partial [Myxococcota bacterium]|nr:RAMP superfamily CRISPR-associated protein [Myxococcota bacterium]